MMKIFKVFFGSVLRLKLQFAKRDKITVGNKMIAGVKVAICKENLKSGIFIYWVRTHWLGAML
jgi:hypothetical protein